MNDTMPSTIALRQELSRWLNNQKDREYIVQKTPDGVLLRPFSADIKRIYLELTTRCNLACKFCIRHHWDERTMDMSIGTFEKFLHGLLSLPHLEEIVLGGYGEPLHAPLFLSVIKEIKKMRPALRLSITTNGTLLNASMAEQIISHHVDELIVSIDTFDRMRLNGLRGADLDMILENIRRLNIIKKKANTLYPLIGLEFVAMQSNFDELFDLGELIEGLEIAFVLVSNLLPHIQEMNDQILYDGTYPDQAIDNVRYYLPFKLPAPLTLAKMRLRTERRCQFITRNATVIAVDGSVCPCYPFMHSHHCYIMGREKSIQKVSFGNINKSDLLEVWNSNEYWSFRNTVRDFRFPSCTDCELAQGCYWSETNEEDCWLNSPSCADCLWSRGIILCP